MVVSDEAFADRASRWPDNTPDTKEAYYIRDIFDGLFPTEAAASTAVRSVKQCLPHMFTEKCYRWIPRGDWGCASDPSGRSVSVHNAAYENTD